MFFCICALKFQVAQVIYHNQWRNLITMMSKIATTQFIFQLSFSIHPSTSNTIICTEKCRHKYITCRMVTFLWGQEILFYLFCKRYFLTQSFLLNVVHVLIQIVQRCKQFVEDDYTLSLILCFIFCCCSSCRLKCSLEVCKLQVFCKQILNGVFVAYFLFHSTP